MNNVLSIIPNLKIFYLILIILIMTIINIILNKRKINTNYKYFINGISLITLALVSNYFNDIIDGIFKLNFLSVKFYIVILIITNIITLITMQKKLKKAYKIANYLLFILMTIILGIILVLITGTKLNLISTTTSQYSIIFLNISIIIFVLYLITISIIYITININNQEEINEEKLITIKKLNLNQLIKKITILKKENIKIANKDNDILSPEELLSLSKEETFYINGEECSIIFEDSIPENIIKNYHILLDDINAKLVNGYTLEENKLLKSVYTKLQVTDLNNIDINNISILNKISIKEYNLLKKILDPNK